MNDILNTLDADQVAATAASPIPEDASHGRFLGSLVRSNRQIKAGRAESMADSTKIVYRRRVEDLVAKVKKLKRESIDALDLSGDSALSLKMISNYDENAWVQADVERRMEIRNTMIQLSAVYAGYADLFGATPGLLDGLDISGVNLMA